MSVSGLSAMTRAQDLVRHSIEAERNAAAITVQQAWRVSQVRRQIHVTK